MKPQTTWTKEKIETLRTKYPEGDLDSLAEELEITRKCLKHAASRFKTKRLPLRNCRKILNGSLESYYWLGFLIADGNISRGGIRFCLNVKDRKHLKKFTKFLGYDQKYILRSYDTSYGKSNGAYLNIGDKHTVGILTEKFGIMENKTKFPPNFEKFHLTDDHFFSFLIGFFDGDGCWCKESKTQSIIGIKFEVDSTCLSNLIYSNKFFQKYIGKNKSKPKLNTRGYGMWRYYGYDYITKMSNIRKNFKLPVLSRKWTEFDYFKKH